jgi:hypothetical protein
MQGRVYDRTVFVCALPQTQRPHLNHVENQAVLPWCEVGGYLGRQQVLGRFLVRVGERLTGRGSASRHLGPQRAPAHRRLLHTE